MTGLDEDVAAIGRIDVVPMILEVICRSTGMRFAAVARVTEDRWLACSVRDDFNFGLKAGDEVGIEQTVCRQVRASGEAAVVGNLSEGARFPGDHLANVLGYESYISMPIRWRGGEFFGTLCALDPEPRVLNTPETVGMFRLFADLIGFHLDAQERLASTEAALLTERQTAELRDQFVAVLGHDLRNPLAAIDSAAMFLGREPLNESAAAIVALIRKTVRRIASLIDNVLDFTQVRLGGRLRLDEHSHESISPALEQVVAEMRASWPDRTIDVELTLSRPMTVDRVHVAQLLSNLLGNALLYGAKDKPVVVRGATSEDAFELSVSNQGDPMPAAVIERLFQPFFRATQRSNQQGMGLGLYVASEIARAHGGALDVVSTAAETRFTFRMPIQ